MGDYGIFLGTGTSQGVPVINCPCEVCNSLDFRNKRLRTSFFTSIGGVNIVVDPGPDFRQQMLRNNIGRIDGIIVTHEHKDHTGGLDDIRAYNFFQHEAITVYGFSRTLESLRREYAYIFADKKYPGLPQIILEPTDGDSFSIKGVEFQLIRVMHAQLEVLAFRVGDFTYITDANLISDENHRKIHKTKFLVLNALQHEPHISHFTLQEALREIERIEPEKAFLTHISHKLGLHSDVNATLPAYVRVAYDGQKLAF
jgi:phosphoribosyl 1,2-cyclic phosphate phosphodiesterase